MRDLVRTELADEDIRNALAYLDELSPVAAERLVERVESRCEHLRTNPFMGRVRDEFRPGLRSIVVGDHLLFYHVTDAEVVVVRFIHGSRDLPAVFDPESP